MMLVNESLLCALPALPQKSHHQTGSGLDYTMPLHLLERKAALLDNEYTRMVKQQVSHDPPAV